MVALDILLASLAAALLGTNVALLAHLGGRLARWFRVKLAAVMLLLVYVICSALAANPQDWRVGLGFVALVVDFGAVIHLWYSIRKLQNQGIIGLVPLIQPKKDA